MTTQANWICPPENSLATDGPTRFDRPLRSIGRPARSNSQEPPRPADDPDATAGSSAQMIRDAGLLQRAIRQSLSAARSEVFYLTPRLHGDVDLLDTHNWQLLRTLDPDVAVQIVSVPTPVDPSGHHPLAQALVVDATVLFLRGSQTNGWVLHTRDPRLAASYRTGWPGADDQPGQPGATATACTHRECIKGRAVLETMCQGLSDDAAARTLGVSVRTYRRRVAVTLDHIGADTRFQAGFLIGARPDFCIATRETP